jgi:C4-dicarboxylate-specific signal transduction histidine kinase
MTDQKAAPPGDEKPRYRWPWVVAAFVLLAIALAILWMSHEVARTEQIRKANEQQTR